MRGLVWKSTVWFRTGYDFEGFSRYVGGMGNRFQFVPGTIPLGVSHRYKGGVVDCIVRSTVERRRRNIGGSNISFILMRLNVGVVAPLRATTATITTARCIISSSLLLILLLYAINQ